MANEQASFSHGRGRWFETSIAHSRKSCKKQRSGSAGPLPVFRAGTRMVPGLEKVFVTVLNFVVAERSYVAGRPPPEASRPSTSITSCRGTALPSASSAPASSAPEMSSTLLSTATRVSG